MMHLNMGLSIIADDGSLAATSIHRSTWHNIFGQRDGWWAGEEDRLPTMSTPHSIVPVEINSPYVLISAFKMADRAPEGGLDNSSDMIVKLYSLAEAEENVSVRFNEPISGKNSGLVRIYCAGLDEVPSVEALESDAAGSATFKMRPFEINTLRVRRIENASCC